MIVDHYRVLGVSPDSTPDQIKLAWRELARRHHPDKGGDSDVFKSIKESYEVLSDADRRRVFDMGRKAVSTLTCSCGKVKLPGSDLCAWCGLRRSQAVHEADAQRARERRREKLREVAGKIFTPKQPKQPKPKGAPRRSTSKGPTIDWPSADAIFEGVMAEAAIRSGLVDAGLDMDVRVQVDPLSGQVKLSGKTVDAVQKIRRNLQDMNRFVEMARGKG